MSAISQNINRLNANQPTQQITPDEEIRQLKEYIQQIFFKEEDDYSQKEEFLNSIQELELIKLDEDFYYHLYLIYEKIVVRQQQNVEEFKQSSTKIDEQRKEIEDKDLQIIEILNEHTQFKLDGIRTNLKLIDKQFSSLEEQLFISKNNLDQHIEEICQTVQKSKEDFDNSIRDVNLSLQANTEYIQQEKQKQEQKKNQIIELKQNQDILKKSLSQNEEALQKICSQMEKTESQETRNSYLEQLKFENEQLARKRLALDTKLSEKRMKFDELLLNNQIVEKRQALLAAEFASNFVKGRQRDQLLAESEKNNTEYNTLRERVQNTKENTQKINLEIATIKKKKQLKTNLNIILVILILLIMFTFLYRFK